MAKSKTELDRDARMQELVAQRAQIQEEADKHAAARADAERLNRAAKKKIETINAEIVKVATEKV